MSYTNRNLLAGVGEGSYIQPYVLRSSAKPYQRLFKQLKFQDELKGWAAREQSGATPHSRFLRPEFYYSNPAEANRGVRIGLFV